MASPAVMPSLLQALTPRPPTPPREATVETEAQKQQLLAASNLHPTSSTIHTPPGANTPGSGISSSRRKRVGFSAQAQYQDPPVYIDGEPKKVPTPISLPSSTGKAIKSILKVTCGPNPLAPNTDLADCTGPNANLGIMLDSTIQHLAGADRDSRVDAYMMLIRALKASNNLPDRVALQEKMSLFMQFIQRDITAKTPAGSTDSSLVNQSLNLLVTFLNFPAIASTLTNDFAIYMIDHCIRSFEDPATSKEVARHLMQVITVQRFSVAKVMSLDRVGRLIASLHKIEEHLKGKSIDMARLHIYRKLVGQCRQAMVVHSDWLYDLFAAMLSELKDIRIYAINLGLEAGFTIGREKSISRKTMEIFNQTNEAEDKRYIELYTERLTAMVHSKADLGAVPQIWSVVMLFLRIPLDRWNQMGRWLKIIQLCFNSSDLRSKIEANAAWCRLGYLMLMDEKSLAKAHSIMTQPFKSQLRRKEATGKQAEEFRQSVLGGIRHLLYYTFRPNANLTLLDSHWDSCVKDLLTQMLDASTTAAYDGTNNAAAILAGLFDCTTPRVWKEERGTEKSVVEASELPAIDPKWVRRNAARVFELVEPIMLKNINDLNNTASPTYRLWRNLVHAVNSAAAKEIKVSLDTTLFVAQALNLLQKLWKQGPPEGDAKGFLKAVQTYLSVMVDSLGLLPFSEKHLSLDKEQRFVPIATPTHRPNKGRATKTPLKHLFSFLSTLPNGVPDDQKYYDFFSGVFSPFMANKNEKGRMELALELLSTIPTEARIPWAPWEFASEKLIQWLTYNNRQTTGSGSDIPIGHEYREYVRLVERGWRSTPGLPDSLWISLFHTIVSCVDDEAGEAGVAIVVIEPLAKMIDDLCSTEGQPLPTKVARWVDVLLSTAVQPRDRQAVDAARRRLWGSGPRSGSASFDTFDNLYKSANLVLEHAYKARGFADRDIASLLLKVGEFLERCNPQLVAKSLLALQSGLSPWIQDEHADSRPQTKEIVQAARLTWQKVCAVLSGYDRSQLQLDGLEPLLCAAFASKHIQVVNSAVELWNRVFEDTDEIQYPENLKRVLQDLCKRAGGLEIHLPGLEDSSLDPSSSKEPYFVDSQSQDEVQLPQLQTTKSSKRATPRTTPRPSSRPLSSHLSSPAVRASGHTSKKRSLDLTTHERLAKVAKRNTPTPKLRHDDSQIQFAPIEESSPVLQEEAESQALTDRQKEVRERQKETATIFKDIRSSPTRKAQASSRPPSAKASSPAAHLPEIRRAATPEPTRNLEEYVSSTPTPRRGLPVVLLCHDSDMADVPSSPPEPRRNPLLQEIQSRSASKTALDDWQFSSSPVGSPVPLRHTADVRAGHMEIDDDVLMSDVDVDLPTANDSHDQLEPELGESAALERIARESIIRDKSESPVDNSVVANVSEIPPEETAGEGSVADDSISKAAGPEINSVEEPSTPAGDRMNGYKETPELPSPAVAEPPSSTRSSRTRKNPRSSLSSQPSTRPATRATSSEKPKPTPPLKPTTRRASTRKAASTAGSFEYSELDDSSLQKLVVELDANVNSDEYEYRQVTESPAAVRKLNETPRRKRTKKSAEVDAEDCIVVSSPYKAAEEGGALSSIPETIPEEPEVVESSQVSHSTSLRSSRRKRKRGNAAALAAARKKKKSLRSQNANVQKEDEDAHATQESVDLSMSQPGFAMSFSSMAESVPESQLSAASDAMHDDGDAVAVLGETEDLEHEVRSQIEQEAARQTQESGADAMELEPGSEAAKKASAGASDDAAFETATEAAVEISDEPAQEATRAAPVQPQPESSSPFQKLIGFFRGGLEVLKSAALSRTETLQVEDMFMDVRRELIEAEVRGRAASS